MTTRVISKTIDLVKTAIESATWYYGSMITGKDVNPNTFPYSGINSATEGDMYINTSTSSMYQCDLGGEPSIATWKYIGNVADTVNLDNIQINQSQVNGLINDLNTKANNLDLNNTTIDARSALAQFSDVKDVLGVLGWISEHGSYSLTTDTEVDKNKAYYSYNNVSGTYTQVSIPSSTAIKDMYELITDISYIKTKDEEIEPNKEYYIYDGTNFILVQNPIVDDINLYYEKITTSRYEKTNDLSPVSGKTYYKYDIETNQYIAATPTQTIGQYYELSIEESIKDYLLTHLSVSNGALSVKNDNNSYYMVLEGSGASIKNSLGQTVAFYGNEITLGNAVAGIVNKITSSKISFTTSTGDVAYFGLNTDNIWEMHIDTASVDDMMFFGDFAWIKRDNGNLSLKWMGN